MKQIQHFACSITVKAPVGGVYNQFLCAEAFPGFAPSVVAVHHLGHFQTLWQMRVWGRKIKRRMEIYDLAPEHSIAWRSHGRHFHHGVVTFEADGPDATLVTVEIDYQPRGFIGKTWALLGAIERRVSTALKNFCWFVEQQPAATTGRHDELQAGVGPLSSFPALAWARS